MPSVKTANKRNKRAAIVKFGGKVTAYNPKKGIPGIKKPNTLIGYVLPCFSKMYMPPS
jgi:hypothetical protein